MATLPEGFRAGFAIPQQFPGGRYEMGMVRHMTQRAEAMGFDSLWSQEQSAGRSHSLEPVALLSYLAAVTDRVRLGVAVHVLPLHHPVRLAQQLATLDVMSGGRVIAGVGLGNRGRFNALFGDDGAHRVRRFVEGLAVMRAIWDEEEASYQGELYRLDRVPVRPRPVQPGGPPVWFGARTEPALRRAARLADGWMGAGSSSAEQFKGHVRILHDALGEQGRDPKQFPISKRVYLR